MTSIFGIWTLSFFVPYVSVLGSRASVLLSSVVPDLLNDSKRTVSASTKAQLHSAVTLSLTLGVVLGSALIYGGVRIRFLAWDGAFLAGDTRTVRTAGVWPRNTLRVREQLLRHHLGLEMDGKPGPGYEFNTPGWEEIIKLTREDYR